MGSKKWFDNFDLGPYGKYTSYMDPMGMAKYDLFFSSPPSKARPCVGCSSWLLCLAAGFGTSRVDKWDYRLKPRKS